MTLGVASKYTGQVTSQRLNAGFTNVERIVETTYLYVEKLKEKTL